MEDGKLLAKVHMFSLSAMQSFDSKAGPNMVSAVIDQ
jgi:hypothetical protein